MYALRFDKNGMKDVSSKEDFEKVIDKNLIQQIDQTEKFKFIIELEKFINMSYEINSVLSTFGYFLRVFELKNKFPQLTMKDKSKQKIVRQLSSCLIEKYSGFTVNSIVYQKKQRKLFKTIDILCKQTRHIEIEYFVIFS